MEAATAVRMKGENRWFSGVTDGGNKQGRKPSASS